MKKKSHNCLNCTHFTKILKKGSYLVYRCDFWNLESYQMLPCSAVISSIGKRCEFFSEKSGNSNIEENSPKKTDSNTNDGIDVTI